MGAKKRGFTLVEVICLTAILGIVAAAAPRYVSNSNGARVAATDRLAVELRFSVNLTQAAWQVAGGTSGVKSISMAGSTVTVNSSGFPSTDNANGIMAAMGCTGSPCQGVSVAGNGRTWTPPNAGICSVSYDSTTGVVTVNGILNGGQLAGC